MEIDLRPITLAAKTYDDDCTRGFDDDLCYYLMNGWVYSGEDAFIMGRPITKRYSNFALDQRFNYKKEEWDTWFVYLAAGTGVRRFQELAPFKTDWICWHRRTDRKLRIFSWDKFYEKAKATNKEN